MIQNAHLPIVGFAAYSGTGKTTLLKKLLPILKSRSVRVGMVKHAHHTFDVDQPGKDSYELRKAGAAQMLIASRSRWALMVERQRDKEPLLDEVLLELDQAALDLILVEGFKQEPFPKIELRRAGLKGKPFFPDDDNVVAIATDDPSGLETDLPILDLNRPDEIADFIIDKILNGGRRAASG
ncbi:MAG: molybdopterin-guanine dinucleotide biosynthesis protein B [Gammaproteobacteria bacterium]|nr:molybdopterin-guanine dinucleotide biosynthesis protein B [Gammaproteobacteria bacterium]